MSVVACDPFDKPSRKLFAIQLDRTICYPEGGGQPGDRAILSEGDRSCRIIDTRKEIPEDSGDVRIVHIVEGPCPFVVGDHAHLTLDWPHRYEFMRQHTAQHMISGLLYTRFGIGTVSVHQGDEILTVETDRTDISIDTLRQVEALVNEAIRSRIPVTYEERSHREAESLGLRRGIKVEGDVRLVRIGNLDVIACGGLHVASTDEVVAVLFVGTEMIRGHVRTIWKTAERAVSEIHRNQDVVRSLVSVFSAQPQDLAEKAEQLQAQVTDAQWHRQKTALRLATSLLLSEQQACSCIVSGTPVVTLDISAEPELALKQFAEQLDSYEAIALCVVQEKGGKLSWLIGLKGPLADRIPFEALRSRLLPLIGGKGGGRPPVWQGVGSDVANLIPFLESFKSVVMELGGA